MKKTLAIRPYRCRYATIQTSDMTGEHRLKCVPRTGPGEAPAWWQELGWAKNWITVPLNSLGIDPCRACKRFREKQAAPNGVET